MSKVKLTTHIDEETYARLTHDGRDKRGIGHKIDELSMYEGLCIFCQSEEIKALLAKQREEAAAKNRRMA